MYQMSQEEFRGRRAQFIAAMEPDSVAILVGNPVRSRSADTHFPYRPSSDVFYLSGFDEPETVLVLAPDHAEGEFVMFVRARDPLHEQWEGRRAGPKGAVERFGADKAFTMAELDTELPKWLEGRKTLYYTLGQDTAFDARVTQWINKLRHRRNAPPAAPAAIVDARDMLHEQRLHKRPAEIAAMRRAVEVTAQAHIWAMRACRPGMHEYELQAIVEYCFRRHGATFPAYSSIVGTGDNATILHYTENHHRLGDGDIVLLDAGCELGYYAGDITRSFPANGRFSPAQRDMYQAVLEVQKQVVQSVRPGLTYSAFRESATRLLTEAMVQLGLLKGSVEELIATRAFARYYPHGIGHWLGMDVHDVGSYHALDGQWRELVPGMIVTVEPGLYVPASDESAPEGLRGVGIRIEDDILVTEAGHENLSHMCPKEVADLEAIIGTVDLGDMDRLLSP